MEDHHIVLEKIFSKGDYYPLDGGFASHLGHYLPGVDDDPLWSARSLHTRPDLVARVHQDFVAAGARIVTTASYQASLPGLKQHLGIDADGAGSLIERSVSLAREGVRAAGRVPGFVLLAGSVGPYGACQHDGSEYTGAYLDTVGREELAAWHLPRMQALQDGGVDLLAVETLPSWREAVAVMDAMGRLGCVRGWVPFS